MLAGLFPTVSLTVSAGAKASSKCSALRASPRYFCRALGVDLRDLRARLVSRDPSPGGWRDGGGGKEEKRKEEQKDTLVLNARSTCEPEGQRSSEILLNAELKASWSWWEVLGGWRRRSYGSSASGATLLTRADGGLSCRHCCCSSLHLSSCSCLLLLLLARTFGWMRVCIPCTRGGWKALMQAGADVARRRLANRRRRKPAD